MTPEQLKMLAEHVGYKYSHTSRDCVYVLKLMGRGVKIIMYDPTTNGDQAWELVEKFDIWLRKFNGSETPYFAVCEDSNYPLRSTEAEGKNPQEA